MVLGSSPDNVQRCNSRNSNNSSSYSNSSRNHPVRLRLPPLRRGEFSNSKSSNFKSIFLLYVAPLGLGILYHFFLALRARKKHVLRLGYEYSAPSALNPKSLNPFFLLLLLLLLIVLFFTVWIMYRLFC